MVLFFFKYVETVIDGLMFFFCFFVNLTGGGSFSSLEKITRQNIANVRGKEGAMMGGGGPGSLVKLNSNNKY